MDAQHFLAVRTARAVVGQAAGDDQPAGEAAKPAVARGVVEGGRGMGRGGVPGQRGALKLGRADVQAAVGEDSEGQAAAGVEVERARTPRSKPSASSLRRTPATWLRSPVCCSRSSRVKVCP